jgi:hypothetical protein
MMSVFALQSASSADLYLSDQSAQLAAPIRRLFQVGRERGAPTSLTEAESTSSSAAQARRRFYSLAKRWREETRYVSSVHDMVLHPAYQQIIGMGKEALPFLFRELKRQPDHWFWALRAITGKDPVPPEEKGNVEAMTQRWLRWGAENAWIFDEQ